jgi:hypothetical protein
MTIRVMNPWEQCSSDGIEINQSINRSIDQSVVNSKTQTQSTLSPTHNQLSSTVNVVTTISEQHQLVSRAYPNPDSNQHQQNKKTYLNAYVNNIY